MTKRRNTKSALISAILVLCMLFTSLIGTTFAWFTDSVTSSGNIIQTGNLDVQLLMHNGTEYVDISESDKPIFGENSLVAEWEDVDLLWEPGKTQIVYLGVKNAGSLALKYNVVVDVVDNGLVGALDYAIVDGATKDDADKLGVASWADIVAIDGVQTGLIQSGRTVAANNGALESNSYDYFALAVHMNKDAGNEYQDKNIVIDITIMATQLSSEEDSFGPDYDADAPIGSTDGMVAKIDNRYFASIQEAINAASAGDTVVLLPGYNTSDAPLTETIIVDKEIVLEDSGMYLVSSAPATFTVVEGGKLTINDGSYTVKNTATNGAAVLVAGGEFEMAGGSFDAHTAVRTTEGKSSTVTLAAGWSNSVTVGFDLKGDDTLNVTGGTLISSQESIVSNGKLTINMSGGTLSGKPARQNQYNPSVVCNGETTINMTGGKIETTANQSVAVCISKDSEISLSGDAVIAGTAAGIRVGDFSGRDLGDNCEINVGGNAKVTANGAGNSAKIGYAVQVNATNTVVTVSADATVDGSAYGVYAGQDGCVVNVSGNAYIKANSSCPEGYGVGASNINITGGKIEGKVYGVICDFAEGVVVIDNSVSGDSITINNINVGRGAALSVNGDPTLPNGFAYVENQTHFEAALNDASLTYIYLADGAYKMPSSNVSKTVKIAGSKNAVLDLTLGAYMENATVTFDGLTIKTSTGMANGNGSDYAAFYSKNVKYSYCTFVGPMRVGRDGASFEYCTFTELGNDYVWTHGNDVTFKYCTFNTDGKAILIYSDGGNEISTVTVTNCTFNSTQGAKAGAIANQNCAAIEIDNYGCGVKLTANNNTYDENFSGEWRIKSYYDNSNTVTVGKLTSNTGRVTYTSIALDGKTMTIDADKNVTVNE